MDSKYAAFNVTDVAFKEVNGHQLKTSIFVPNKAKSTNLPLLVHFHGGGLVVGDRMYAPWWPMWLIDFAASQEAIMLSPDYRLLPEATGVEILDDVQDFWNWVHKSLPAEIAKISPELTVNLDRIAVAGESAGGYLSLQSAFLFPEAKIKLIMSQYGAIDIGNPAYNPPPANPPLKSLMSDFIKNVKPGAVRLSSMPPNMVELIGALVEEGCHRKLIGPGDKNYIVKNLQQTKTPPPMWLVQGVDDPIIPVSVHRDLVVKIKELHPTALVHDSVCPGSHGFDVMTSLDEPWVQEGVKFSIKYW